MELAANDTQAFRPPYCPVGLSVKDSNDHFFVQQMRSFLARRADQIADLRQRLGLQRADQTRVDPRLENSEARRGRPGRARPGRGWSSPMVRGPRE